MNENYKNEKLPKLIVWIVRTASLKWWNYYRRPIGNTESLTIGKFADAEVIV